MSCPTLARYVPVTLGHRYLGVPVAAAAGVVRFDRRDADLLRRRRSTGCPRRRWREATGSSRTSSRCTSGSRPRFSTSSTTCRKIRSCRSQGLRACRQLLAYLLREIGIQRQRLLDGEPVDDTMLTRLVQFQLGRPAPTCHAAARPRSAAGQRSAHRRKRHGHHRRRDCRPGRGHVPRHRFADPAAGGRVSNQRTGRLSLRQLCRGDSSWRVNVLSGRSAKESRAELRKYFLEALRLQPQGEVLLRKCARDGSQIAGSRPLSAGTLVFASHGSAMKDVPEPDAFILDRPREHYLQYGWSRHTCLGQYVSPVIIVEIDDRAAGSAGSRASRAASGRVVVSVRAAFRPASARRSEPLRHDLFASVCGLRHDAALLAVDAGELTVEGIVECATVRWQSQAVLRRPRRRSPLCRRADGCTRVLEPDG